MSSEIYEEARQLLDDRQISYRHTFFQLKHFVLGKELTTQSKMQKCLKEMQSRFDSVTNMELSIEDMKDDIRILELKILSLEKKRQKTEIGKEFKLIEIKKLNRKKNALTNTLKNIISKHKEAEEEMAFFLSAYKQLEKIEPLRNYDDQETNAQLWNENLSQELQLRLLLQKPLDLELVKCILALNKDAPIRLEMINILDQIQKKSLEFSNKKIENK
jgi:hypothetical protein